MTVDRHIRGYIRPTETYPESAQRELLTAEIIYVEGKRGESRKDILSDLRSGNTLEVTFLGLLAEPRDKKKCPNPHADLFNVMRELKARGIVIREAATGWTTEEDDLRDEMVFRAGEFIRRGRRSDQARINGRKNATKVTHEQRAIMERMWFDMRIKTDLDVVAALAELGIRTNKMWLYRAFKKAGRPRVKKP